MNLSIVIEQVFCLHGDFWCLFHDQLVLHNSCQEDLLLVFSIENFEHFFFIFHCHIGKSVVSTSARQ